MKLRCTNVVGGKHEDLNRVFIVDMDRVLYFDGSTWSTIVQGLVCTAAVLDGWGNGNEFFRAGQGGIVKWENETWTDQLHFEDPRVSMHSLWGFDSGELITVGSEPADEQSDEVNSIVYWNDGSEWIKIGSIQTSDFLSELWGATSNSVWAVGSSGTIVHITPPPQNL